MSENEIRESELEEVLEIIATYQPRRVRVGGKKESRKVEEFRAELIEQLKGRKYLPSHYLGLLRKVS
jgi:hemerythrin superfamily protein